MIVSILWLVHKQLNKGPLVFEKLFLLIEQVTDHEQ